ncbi:hypothetical protein DFP72DRAFT_1077930 [Ephemerocybe angulata]|uniref:F-box domain-containing protein n=1 Tax=Ephemerocybe angulata TaxID=980116 RepID=A0A8H6HEN7_9AGAR|nr:hypothetical protein DFP72DRAFT_1077930 [Tulosesus angulatus]
MSTQTTVGEPLPYDVLVHISDKVYETDFASLCTLRLVSKATNEIAEPKVFASTSISFTNRPYTPSQLEAMASGTSPYSRWTTNLSIPENALIPLELADRDPLQGEERDRLLACQTEFLVPALESLQKLKSVKFDTSRRSPYEDVLSALARLPNLEVLINTNCDYHEPIPAHLEKFSSLRHIALSNIYLYPSTIAVLKRMLARSLTTLEIFALDPHQLWDPDAESYTSVKLEDLFDKGTGTSPSPSLPALRALKVTGVELAATSIPFLRSLVKLQVTSLEPYSNDVEDGFWVALEKSGVHLEHLEMAHLSPAAIKYLISYEGLRELQLGSTSFSKSDDHFAQFGPDVLSKHRKMLTRLSLSCLDVAEFRCTEKDFELIYQCVQLDTLTFGYPESSSEPETAPIIPLDLLLPRLAERLPRLRQLCIFPKPGGTHFMGMSRGAHEKIISTFVKGVCDVHFANTVPRFKLLGPKNCGPFGFDLETRRFFEVKETLPPT